MHYVEYRLQSRLIKSGLVIRKSHGVKVLSEPYDLQDRGYLTVLNCMNSLKKSGLLKRTKMH